MGLLDPTLLRNLKGLTGLLAETPIGKYVRGKDQGLSVEGLKRGLLSIPVFENTPEANQTAYEAAMNIGPLGLGKIVYHGSPHKFDKFDASKIGTGEGAQAYGHGIYLTDSQPIAEHYKKALLNEKGGHFSWEDRAGKEIDVHALAESAQSLDPRALAASALRQAESVDDALDLIGKASPDQFVGGAKEKKATIDGLLSFMRQGVAKRPGGSLIKADLPDEWIPKMLDWDKPLSEQPEAVRALPVFSGFLPDETGAEIYKILSKELAGGSQFAKSKNDAAAEALRDAGIPGIRYLDGGSRGKGQGTYNYVVFPGLEDQVKILERNGVPLGLLGGK